jgi:hypothetical protein
VPVAGISNVGRSTQGVRVISLKAGDKLTAVASVVAKENEDVGEGADEGEGEEAGEE